MYKMGFARIEQGMISLDHPKLRELLSCKTQKDYNTLDKNKDAEWIRFVWAENGKRIGIAVRE